MIANEAKIRIEEALGAAAEELNIEGVLTKSEVEIVTNTLEDGTEEELMVFGSLAIFAEGLTEDETFYLSLEAKVNEGEVDSEALEMAISALPRRVAVIKSRLAAEEDKAAAIRVIGEEVDRELEAQYMAEVERQQKRATRDLVMALVATGAILLASFAAVIITKLVS